MSYMKELEGILEEQDTIRANIRRQQRMENDLIIVLTVIIIGTFIFKPYMNNIHILISFCLLISCPIIVYSYHNWHIKKRKI